MIITLLGVIIALQLLDLFWARPKRPTVKQDQLHDSLHAAFKGCGLNADHYAPEFDLIPSGKLGDFIFHSAEALGRPIRTVKDVHDLLVK